jgi:DNA ligase 1
MTNIRKLDDPDFNGLKLAADWIRDLESSDSRLHKESVIEKALVAARLGSTNAQCFLYNCYLAYNPFFVYNVRQVTETQDLENQPNPWVQFWALLEALRTRSITGHRARDAIADLSQQFDSLEWNNLCRRVLIKDLRCGISDKTLNKVLKNTDWAIPVFTCQLAQDSTEHPAKMKGRKRLEVKLDGVRVLAVCSPAGVTLYSRNGKVFENFPQIAEVIEANYRMLPPMTTTGGSFVLDGEIVGESFQQLMKQAHRKGNARTDNMVYHVFDLLPLWAFEEGFHNAQQHKRLELLEKCRPLFDATGCLRVMTGIEVDLDMSEGQNIMRRFADDAVAQGFEGIMIKDQDAPYECRRSSFWMKWKPVITVDLNIVGFEEGTGKNLGRLGAIVCEGVDNDRRINVNVGSGLTDSDRDSFWADRDQLLGRVVEVKADAVTQNQDGTYSLRFPRFERFRDALTGEKE